MTRGAILTIICILSWPLTSMAQRGVQSTLTDTQGKSIPLYHTVHVLVVGVGNYQQLPKLPNVYQEAEDAGLLFKQLGYQVAVLHDPTSAGFKDALNRLAYQVTDPDDAVLLFFAGHGYTEKLVDGTQLGYVLPVDCPLYDDKDPGKFVDLAISMNSIEEYALRTKAKHMLCIFDSCFSGTIFYSSRSIPERVSFDTVQPVRQFITAGTEKEEVPDVSLFFSTFKRGLTGDADVNRDGYVTATELGMYLQEKVETYSTNAEHPQYGKIRNPDLDKGDFVFVLRSGVALTKGNGPVVAPTGGNAPGIKNGPVVAPTGGNGPGIKPTIHVWSVGSPYTGAKPENIVPPGQRIEAGRYGYQIEMETFEAKDFAARFSDAVAEKREPDLLVIDNWGIIDGTTTKLGTFTGIASNPSVQRSLIGVSESLNDFEGPQRGWVFLVSTSQNHNVAKAFALRKPECDPNYAGVSSISQTELRDIKEIAVSASYAYLTCNSVELGRISDGARLGTGCFLHHYSVNDPPPKVASSTACGVFGNQNLLFVPTVNAFEAQQMQVGKGSNFGNQLGRKTLLVILRRNGGKLKLLTITDDVLTLEQLTTSIPKLARLLKSENGADSQPVTPASLVTPDGTYPVPTQGARFGDFIWRPSSSPSVVCEIAEFEYGFSTRLFFSFKDSGLDGAVSAGKLYSGGRWDWRVWSITGAGRVYLSEQRSFKN
jgi:Caspase domain